MNPACKKRYKIRSGYSDRKAFPARESWIELWDCKREIGWLCLTMVAWHYGRESYNIEVVTNSNRNWKEGEHWKHIGEASRLQNPRGAEGAQEVLKERAI